MNKPTDLDYGDTDLSPCFAGLTVSKAHSGRFWHNIKFTDGSHLMLPTAENERGCIGMTGPRAQELVDKGYLQFVAVETDKHRLPRKEK